MKDEGSAMDYGECMGCNQYKLSSSCCALREIRVSSCTSTVVLQLVFECKYSCVNITRDNCTSGSVNGITSGKCTLT